MHSSFCFQVLYIAFFPGYVYTYVTMQDSEEKQENCNTRTHISVQSDTEHTMHVLTRAILNQHTWRKMMMAIPNGSHQHTILNTTGCTVIRLLFKHCNDNRRGCLFCHLGLAKTLCNPRKALVVEQEKRTQKTSEWKLNRKTLKTHIVHISRKRFTPALSYTYADKPTSSAMLARYDWGLSTVHYGIWLEL